MIGKLGKYDIIKEVGKGSTGTVYLSHDPFYGRDVAIKVYHMEATREEDLAVVRKMFFNEANMVGMLQHPNILPIYDAGDEGTRYYVVMEHVHGARTLAAYCDPKNLMRIADVVEIVFKCAKALHYSHGRGVIHRDIKPSNIMLTTASDVRIIDFGIALRDGSETSQISGIAGSPSYMSPEQVQGGDITHRSDIYSLGAVMYELLTGYRPLRAPTLSKLLHQIVYNKPTSMDTYRPGLPAILEEVVLRAMEKEPEKRYKNGLDFAADLTRAFQQLQRQEDQIDQQQRFEQLRRLSFFHDFSHGEIWEVLRASDWHTYAPNEEIVREGEMDDRFYIIVEGKVQVHRNSFVVGDLRKGDCFGETSYVQHARRTASIKAACSVTLLRVSSTLLEQVSAACQLRFTKMFLRSLIRRLQSADEAHRATHSASSVAAAKA